MSSGADLFVVCKHCEAQVSPYVTECPYCGHRLRRRAPELPRAIGLQRSSPDADVGRAKPRSGGQRRLAFGRFRGRTRSDPVARIGLAEGRTRGLAWDRPYATIALVLGGAGVWLATQGFLGVEQIAVEGPLRGQWWRLFTTQFAYINGIYACVVLAAIALFGSLVEKRHGPVVVLIVFFGCGVSGTLVALAVYPDPVVLGANAGALGLLGCWAVPDLLAARGRSYYEGDLLGAAAFATVLLVIPFARPEASWAAGVTGGVVGLVLGIGLNRVSAAA